MNVVIKSTRINKKSKTVQRTEADILKQLHHPGIPAVLDYFQNSDYQYVVMQYIRGTTFEEKLQKGLSLSNLQLLRYSSQLCHILIYLHSMKPPIYHGDIKPSNVMLTNDGKIYLIDFNVSGFISSEKNRRIGYSKYFASPEQQNEEMRIDERTDIYSMGALMKAIAYRKKRNYLIWLIIDRTMQENRKKRIQSAVDLLSLITIVMILETIKKPVYIMLLGILIWIVFLVVK